MPEVLAETDVIEEKVNQDQAAHKDLWDKIKVVILIGSLSLNLFGAVWAQRAQLVAAAEARQSEQRRLACELLEKLWPLASHGSESDQAMALAAIRAVWPELANALEQASQKRRLPKAIFPLAPPATGKGGRNSARHPARADPEALVEQARTFGHFGLYAQADRVYLEAAENARFNSDAERNLLAQAKADFEADRFQEANRVFQKLFEAVKQ